jgi:hypothetical protein
VDHVAAHAAEAHEADLHLSRSLIVVCVAVGTLADAAPRKFGAITPTTRNAMSAETLGPHGRLTEAGARTVMQSRTGFEAIATRAHAAAGRVVQFTVAR